MAGRLNFTDRSEGLTAFEQFNQNTTEVRLLYGQILELQMQRDGIDAVHDPPNANFAEVSARIINTEKIILDHKQRVEDERIQLEQLTIANDALDTHWATMDSQPVVEDYETPHNRNGCLSYLNSTRKSATPGEALRFPNVLKGVEIREANLTPTAHLLFDDIRQVLAPQHIFTGSISAEELFNATRDIRRALSVEIDELKSEVQKERLAKEDEAKKASAAELSNSTLLTRYDALESADTKNREKLDAEPARNADAVRAATESLHNIVNEQKTEINTMRESILSKDAEITKLKTRGDQLQASENSLKAQLENAQNNDHAKVLEEQKQGAQKVLEIEEQAHANTRSSLRAAQTEAEFYKRANDELVQEGSAAQRTAVTIEEKRKQWTEAKDVMSGLRDEVDRLQAAADRVPGLEGRVRELDTDIQRLNDSVITELNYQKSWLLAAAGVGLNLCCSCLISDLYAPQDFSYDQLEQFSEAPPAPTGIIKQIDLPKLTTLPRALAWRMSTRESSLIAGIRDLDEGLLYVKVLICTNAGMSQCLDLIDILIDHVPRCDERHVRAVHRLLTMSLTGHKTLQDVMVHMGLFELLIRAAYEVNVQLLNVDSMLAMWRNWMAARCEQYPELLVEAYQRWISDLLIMGVGRAGSLPDQIRTLPNAPYSELNEFQGRGRQLIAHQGRCLVIDNIAIPTQDTVFMYPRTEWQLSLETMEVLFTGHRNIPQVGRMVEEGAPDEGLVWNSAEEIQPVFATGYTEELMKFYEQHEVRYPQ